MPLSVACPSCGAKLRVPDNTLGRSLKCPNCGKPVTVGTAPSQPTPIETIEPTSPFRHQLTPIETIKPISPFREPPSSDDVPVLELADDVPVAELVNQKQTKACPFCAETILAAAKVCKHCGRDIDVPRGAAKAAKRAPEASGTKGNQNPNAALVGCGILAAFGVFLLTICSGIFSSNHSGTIGTAESVEKSYQRGAEVGRVEGKRAGEAEGYAASFNNAEKETYRDTVEELYQSHQFQRITLYTFAVVSGFFVLGFLVQWIALYVPRRVGYLRDIDWIVLPKEMTQVDLYELDGPMPTEQKRPKLPSSGPTLLLLLTLLSLIGCKSREEESWQLGHDSSRKVAYEEAWRQAAPRGEQEGHERGKAEAEHAAQTGRAWRLYVTPAILALLFGIIVGVAVQYTVLACCNDAGRVPELVTVAFVPAMKHSLAYSILENKRKLLIWWQEEMRRLTAANQLKTAHIQAVHDAIVRKLKVMTTLEELTQARLLDLAQQELSKIMSDAEQKAVAPVKPSVACPHCGKAISYPRKKAGKTVNCPYANCGRPINLPSNGDGE